ncbi:Exosome complex component rrp4 [Tilletia horrida]|nr:Exosome complex component rrp4 [Tilletia horrida]
MATFSISAGPSRPHGYGKYLSRALPHHSAALDEDEVEQEDEEEEDEFAYMDEQGDGASAQRQRIATTGQPLASSSSFMRGHGAFLDQVRTGSNTTSTPAIVSSLCGTVHLTNRLISVRPTRARYAPEVGDLVVARITDVHPGARRWKCDIRSRLDANLLLSSVNLPGGIQRRKLEADEMQMRAFFAEGDLLVAEVQQVFGDGGVSLHTRSLRYGKLRNGALARVQSTLVQRLKSHFVALEGTNIELTLGLNGLVWVAQRGGGSTDPAESQGRNEGTKQTAGAAAAGQDASARFLTESSGMGGKGIGRDIDAQGVYSDLNDPITPSALHTITRVLSVLQLLNRNFLPISDVTVAQAYGLSVELVPLPSGSQKTNKDGMDLDVTSRESASGTAANALVAGSVVEDAIVEAVRMHLQSGSTGI